MTLAGVLVLVGRSPLRLPGDLILAALPGLDTVDVEPVELLESAAVGLDEEEVDDEGADEHAASEDVTVGEVDGRGDEGGEETDEEVPDPVGGRRDGHGLRTVLGGIQLGGNSPDHGTPGHGL